jgi:hypothetical protein
VTKLGDKMANGSSRKNASVRAGKTGTKPRGLRDWIRFERAEQPLPREEKDGYVRVYSPEALPPSVAKPTLSRVQITKHRRTGKFRVERPETPADLIDTNLKILWADAGFWQQVHERADAYRLRWHIHSEHELELTELPADIWQRLPQEPKARDELFKIWRGQEWRWSSTHTSWFPMGVKSELPRKWFRQLLDDYFSYPELDLCSKLASRHFSENALKAISYVAMWLAEDAGWCLAHQGQIPPTVVRRRVGAPKKAELAKLIESLVPLADANPDATAGEIARMHKPGQMDDTIRKAAKVAKQLARWREGNEKVRFYKAKGKT